MRGFSNFVIPCSAEYVNICSIHIRIPLLGSHNFFQNLGVTSTFLVSEGWHKASSILRTHNSGVTCDPTLFFWALYSVHLNWYTCLFVRGKTAVIISNTQCDPKVLGLILLTSRRHLFVFIQNKLHWHIYRPLRGPTVSEKLPKSHFLGPSLIYQLRLLGSRQHPQSGVLLTSFSTWGTECRLADINLESTGGDKGL